MPRVGFEPTIPVFERAKTVHALDRAVTVIGLYIPQCTKYICLTNLLVYLRFNFENVRR
jgi:hypothetical protein